MRLTQIIEALLFASDAPLSAADLSRVDERLDEDTVEAVVQELRAEYEQNERSFQIYEVGGGYQLLTRPEFVTVLERYDSVPQPSRLSAPALEVLAIIAYRQPLGRAEIEDIRGVGSSGVLRTLQERNLVEPVARGEGLGRPLLYGTTQKFLEHFGFRSLEDLPRPDELPVVLRDRTPAATVPLDDDASPPEAAPEGAPAAGDAADAAAEPAPAAAEPAPAAVETSPVSGETAPVAVESAPAAVEPASAAAEADDESAIAFDGADAGEAAADTVTLDRPDTVDVAAADVATISDEPSALDEDERSLAPDESAAADDAEYDEVTSRR
ncbi:MAG TPA: SMC-Scp complex subunit ScpB [Longimicrobiales bacterium]|nr:SMC-Scp complex subunit ScpB [Longimicrobiales bacterium]